jgi:hypothetical protein
LDSRIANTGQALSIEGYTQRLGERLGEERDPIESALAQAPRVNWHGDDDVDLASMVHSSLDPKGTQGFYEIDARLIFEPPNRIG